MFRIRFHIRFPAWVNSRMALAVALLPLILLTLFTANRVRATAPITPAAPNASNGMRHYYLSKSSFAANEALTACAAGYHFASIWEIADTSALKYNTSLGATGQDSGGGPPTEIGTPFLRTLARGWVRTGHSIQSTANTAGMDNCGGWFNILNFTRGTVANLPSDWTSGEQDLGIWNVEVMACNLELRVWCVQDDSIQRVYLPIIIR